MDVGALVVIRLVIIDMKMKRLICVILLGAGFGSVVSEATTPIVEVEMVAVGDANNPEDVDVSGTQGAVAYEYSIGRYEVTNQEYTDFLNAVDPSGSNQLELYMFNMGAAINGGITFSLVYAPGQRYQVKSGFANKPVVYVTFYSCMRFCNWLHNGAQLGSDTENGAYTLEGGETTPTNGTTVLRNSGAMFAVPTYDEWYKAAFYQPASDGGDVDHYWTFPTRSNIEPNASAPPGASPAANYDDVLTTFTDVGSYTTTVGYYGTYDMAGNAREWVELIYTTSGLNLRHQLGESWTDNGSGMDAGRSDKVSPNSGTATAGFRIVSL